MTRRTPVSRRSFLATGTTGLALAGALSPVNAGAAPANPAEGASKLALLGGEKAVPQPPLSLLRWGAPERDRLSDMVNQNSLFYWKGPQTAALVEQFQTHCPNRYVMTCSSGTAALHIAVAAAGIGPGDEVITSPITDIGTVIGVIYQQAVPVFADLEPGTYNLDVADVERRLTPKSRAIIAVHLAGNPCDLDALKALADRRGLILIEDSAQAWGARYRGRPIGTIGHLACFSLQNSKLVTCGDGGIVASNDDRFGPLLQRFGDKGFDRLGTSGLFENFATNYRMSEPQAAVAAAQLDRLENIARQRSHLGNLLTSTMADIQGLGCHQVHADDRCPYWFYMLRMKSGAFRCDRADFVKALIAEGVPAAAGYIPVPLYGNPVFQRHAFFAGRWPIKELGLTAMDYSKVKCPEAEAILSSGIRVQLNEGMTGNYVEQIGVAFHKVSRYYAT